jgi:hypothetical protein
MAHSYETCPDSGLEYHECPCYLCEEARLKVAVWLRKRQQAPEAWLLGVEIYKPPVFYWRAKEWV